MKLIIPGKFDVMATTESNLILLPNSSLMNFLLLDVREDVPCEQLPNHSLPASIEGMFIELHCRNSKWLLGYLFVGDFNAEENESAISEYLYKLTNFVGR